MWGRLKAPPCLGGATIKILSLDQSTKKTGWSIFVGGIYKKSGLLDYDSGQYTPQERFSLMCKAVSDLIHKEKPELVVFEEVAYQRNPATLIELARLQGVIIGTCLNSQIEFYIYAPSSWRSVLQFSQGRGVKRPDLKRQAQEYVQAHYQLNLGEDEADSVSMGSAFITAFMKEKKDDKKDFHE